MIPPINTARLWHRLEKIASFTRQDMPWTRRAFSEEFMRARAWLKQEFEACGLTTRVDAAGNLIGQSAGADPRLKTLCVGSHSDTVTNGGRYDGILGVVAGLEVAQSLLENGCRLRHPLEVIDFLAEEPTDHGVSCVGSRGFAGTLDQTLLSRRDASGETLASAIARVGGMPDRIPEAARDSQSIAAFLELHIEQGPVLEQAGVSIGVVTHIVGIRRVSITVQGRPDHSGTTPMHLRQDALAGAAHIVFMVRSIAETYAVGSAYVVATVGQLQVFPNSPNAVPGRVEMTLEVRSDSHEVLETLPEVVMATSQPRLRETQTTASLQELTRTPPTACDDLVMFAIEAAASSLLQPTQRLPSGAGHDAQQMARVAPTGMIFIPCLGGRSHCPEEQITPAQAAMGAQVLAGAIVEMDHLIP